MPLFEVKVETRAHEWYEVKARDEAEARENWHLGELTGTEEVEVLDVLSVTEQFDGEEDYVEDFEGDEWDAFYYSEGGDGSTQ